MGHLAQAREHNSVCSSLFFVGLFFVGLLVCAGALDHQAWFFVTLWRSEVRDAVSRMFMPAPAGTQASVRVDNPWHYYRATFTYILTLEPAISQSTGSVSGIRSFAMSIARVSFLRNSRFSSTAVQTSGDSVSIPT